MRFLLVRSLYLDMSSSTNMSSLLLNYTLFLYVLISFTPTHLTTYTQPIFTIITTSSTTSSPSTTTKSTATQTETTQLTLPPIVSPHHPPISPTTPTEHPSHLKTYKKKPKSTRHPTTTHTIPILSVRNAP